MDFFEISQPIKKIGHNKYIIGSQPIDPLVLIEGKTLKTDIGIFKHLFSDLSETKTGSTQNSYIDNLILKTGTFENFSGRDLSSINAYLSDSYIDNLTLKTGTFENFSGDLLYTSTGFSDKLFIQNVDILKTTLEISGNLEATGLHLHEHIDSLSRNLETTGLHLHEHIDSLNGNLETTGSYLVSLIDDLGLNSGSQIISGNYAENRFNLEEAFEEDKEGDVVPTNHPFISDPMWLLKENGDLELRANIWRFNTGPEAFTKDISF